MVDHAALAELHGASIHTPYMYPFADFLGSFSLSDTRYPACLLSLISWI
jgi:hypothetical protein